MRLIEREASDRLIGLNIGEASGVPSTAGLSRQSSEPPM
jgi:hypothetical protein